jgi:HD-GYP domain-containing protein (c-di-GMP phosphodiesterase class II)
MQYINVSSIRQGMILGQDIWDSNGFLLLRRGQKIYDVYVNRLVNMGVIGIYIEDEYTEDIEIKPVIKDATRMKAVQNIRNLYMTTNSSSKLSDKVVEEAVSALQEMVDEIFFNTDPIYDVREFKTEKDYNYYHSVNMATISMIMGTELKLKKPELKMLGTCAAFCDIGLGAIDQEMLEKKGSLTENEISTVQKHPLLGFSMIKEKYSIHSRVGQGVLHHHERFNGTGYPEGLAGEEISLFSRILAVADVYDALISSRPYRAAVPPQEAFEFIMANGGILFDPKIVKVFTRKVAAYPIGTKVSLSDGGTAVVKENHFDMALRPMVKTIDNPEKLRLIDLKNDPGARNLTIVSST